MPIKKHHIGLHHALAGLRHALSTQPNFLIHLTVSTLVIVAGVFFQIPFLEWIIIFFIIALGLVIELLNTAIEATVDVATQKFHPIAKIAKDTAAAAMLVYAVGASVVGLLIFVPKIWFYI